MNHFTVSLLLLAFLLIIFFINRQYSLLLTLTAIFTFELFFIIGSLPIWGVFAVIYFVLSYKYYYKVKIPLLFPLSICYLSYVVSFLLGEHNSIPPLVNPFYLILLYVATCVTYRPTIKTNNIYLIIIIVYSTSSIIYATYEAFSFDKPFFNWIVSTGLDIKEQSESQVRYGLWRAQGFTRWFTFFALSNCISYIMMSNMAIRLRMTSINKYVAAFLCIVFLYGIILTADRTAIATSLLASLSLASLLRKKNNIPLMIAIVLLFIFVYITLADFIDEVVFSMTHSDEVSGSSLDMRIMQFKAAYKYIEMSPIWGHGLYSTDHAIKMFPSLLGSESFVFNVMYQRGVIGITCSLFLFLYTIIFFINKKCYSILTIYLSFVFYNIVTLPVWEFLIYPYLIILYKNQIVEKRQLKKEILLKRVR